MSSSERSLIATTSISESGLEAMIRNTARPMRPNPLMATLVKTLPPPAGRQTERRPRPPGSSSPIRC